MSHGRRWMMYFFRFGIDELPPEELSAIIQQGGAILGGAGLQMVFPLLEEAGYYIIFTHPADADCFRRYIQEHGIVYTEPGDLPLSIKNSAQYVAFLMMAGY